MQSIHLKSIIQYLLVYSQSCCIDYNNFRTFSLLQTETPSSLAIPHQSLPLTCQLPSTTSLLLYFLCLCWKLQINRIIQYVILGDWLLSLSMFSRLIHTVAVLIFFNFPIISHCIHRSYFIYPFIIWWTLKFLLFTIMNNAAMIFVYKLLCEHTFFLFLWVYAWK